MPLRGLYPLQTEHSVSQIEAAGKSAKINLPPWAEVTVHTVEPCMFSRLGRFMTFSRILKFCKKSQLDSATVQQVYQMIFNKIDFGPKMSEVYLFQVSVLQKKHFKLRILPLLACILYNTNKNIELKFNSFYCMYIIFQVSFY